MHEKARGQTRTGPAFSRRAIAWDLRGGLAGGICLGNLLGDPSLRPRSTGEWPPSFIEVLRDRGGKCPSNSRLAEVASTRRQSGIRKHLMRPMGENPP